jgi:hypothetical protein
MQPGEQVEVPNVAAAAMPSVKLPPFWPHSPVLWFSQAECVFATRGLVDQFQRYCHVVAMLPHESLRLVADLVEQPPEENPYNMIKQRLVSSHQMSKYQRAEKLLAMPALGARKPSELMAAMLEVCPRGEEKTTLFATMFLQRLPRELRVLLARVDHQDPKELAERADELWGLHDSPATVSQLSSQPDEEEHVVAALRSERGGGSGRGRGGRGRRARGGQGGGSRPPMESELSREARLAAGLCIKHWRYGEQAHTCVQPCSWPGNGSAGGN